MSNANLTPVFMDGMCAMNKDKNEQPPGTFYGVIKATIKLMASMILHSVSRSIMV